MLIEKDKAIERLNSPDNLINKLSSIGGNGDDNSNDEIDDSICERAAKSTANEQPYINDEESHGEVENIGTERISEDNEHNGPVRIRPVNNGGRRPGDKNIPMFLREVIGTSANLSKTKDVARAFGISKSQTDQLKEGETFHGRINQELKSAIDRNLGKVRDTALDKLMSSLGLLDFSSEKAKKIPYKDLSTIARNMSSIVEKTLPRDERDREVPQIIIYAPKQKTENYYQTVEVIGEKI